MVTVKVEGLRDLEKALAEIESKATRKNVARRVLKKAGEPIQQTWKRLAPKDEHHLEESIKIGNAIRSYQKRGNSGDTVTQFVGIDESEDRRLHIYAEVQEFGNDRFPAQPAGRPAWESEKFKALDVIRTELGPEIDKAAKRAARKKARGK